ncbi:MAG: methyltransferase domain-containing protein [Actinomycetota bacterium]
MLSRIMRRGRSGLLPAEATAGLASLHRLEELARLGQLERLNELTRLAELNRLSRLEHLAELGQLDRLVELERLERVERDMTAVRDQVERRDNRLDALRSLLDQPDLHLPRPTYGVAGTDHPHAAAWLRRCRSVEHYLAPVGDLRVLDVGASGGFVSCYLAARGARVVGWEADERQAEVARTAAAVNGLDPVFRTSDPTVTDASALDLLIDDRLDVALLLGPGPAGGSDAEVLSAAERLEALTARVPLVIVATDGDAPTLGPEKANGPEIAIELVGSYDDPADRTALWAVRRGGGAVEVGRRSYGYDRRTSEAYDGSPMPGHGAGRRYYFGEQHIVKEYRLDGDHRHVNRAQILTEIDVLSRLAGTPGVPELLDFAIDPRQALVVVRRVPGRLLSETLDGRSTPTSAVRVARDVVGALAELERNGLSHNDVRSWNIIDDGERSTLIDYGLVSSDPPGDDVRSLLWVVKALLTGEREDFDPRHRQLPDAGLFTVDAELEKFHRAVDGGELSAVALAASLG